MSKVKQNNLPTEIRLDKWLWAARFFKTRAIARDMIQSGKVQYNGQRAKPSKVVAQGAMLKVPSGWDTKEVEVLALSDKRQSAAIAQSLYRETIESEQAREKNQQARQLNSFHSPRPENRPDKKQRRAIIKFKQHE